MQRIILTIATFAALVCVADFARADGIDPKAARELYQRVTPSLVVVQYTWDSELGRQDLTTAGVVIGDGLVIFSSSVTPNQWPDEQLKDFKIIIPGDDDKEIDAVFQGRDDRTLISYIKAKEPEKYQWKALKLEDAPVEVGDSILSVGLLPKDAGYKSYLMISNVAALLRGPVPQVLVSGDGLGVVGAPVLNAQGQVVGLVHDQNGANPLLEAGGGGGGRRGGRRGSGDEPIAAISNPPKLFVPSREFLESISNPPLADAPIKIPQLGIQGSGLQKAQAEYYDLKGQTAIEINDVVPGFPADKAGIKPQDIIVKMNGQPLERGDEPDEAYIIMTRKVQRMKVGSQVSFSVLRAKGQPLVDINVTLEERPRQSGKAKRFYAEDLGFSNREIVFDDTYIRKIPADTKGVIVALIKPQSSARTGGLAVNDLITRLNTLPVESIDQFKTAYEAFRKDHPREAVVLEVLRGVNTQVVRIEPPQ